MLFGHSRKNGKKAFQPRKHYKERFISLRVIPKWARISTGFGLSQAFSGREDNVTVSTT